MRKLGFEMEFSDCLTVPTVRALYSLWDRDPLEWQDRYGGYAKPKQDYSVWNCMSDGSLRHTNGTRSMWTYFDPSDGEIKRASASKDSDNRRYWQGIEVQSPAFTDLDKTLSELSDVLSVIEKNDGTASRKLYNSMHVHVDISDIEDWRVVAKGILVIHKYQTELKKMGTLWPNTRLFTDEEVSALEEIRKNPDSTKEEWYYQYQVVQLKNGKWKKSGRAADRVRRLVDISPYFNETRPYQTVEFRCMCSTFDVELARKQIEFGRDFVGFLFDGDEMDVESRIKEVLEVRDNA